MFIQQGKTNWILIIIVALIAGAVGGGLVVYINDTIRQTTALSLVSELKNPKKTQNTPSDLRTSQNPNESSIANWRTYRNGKCGYEIKYPSDYTPVEFGMGAGFFTAGALKCYKLGDQAGIECTDSGASISISCFPSKDFLNGASSLSDYIAEGVKSASFSHDFVPKTVTVGNLSGIEAEGLGAGGAYKDIYLQKGNNILEFNVLKDESLVAIYDKMLSTFEFIDK